MSYDYGTIVWGANQVAAMIRNKKMIFTNDVQRPCVWEKGRKTALIESMILNIPIPAVYAKRFDDGSGKRSSNIYDILDGKQRLTTIQQYIDNKFELTALNPITYHDDFTNEEMTLDVSGLKFYELPEGLQEKIKNVRISVVYLDNLTEEEEKEMFRRLNNGKPLSTKSRTLASCKDIKGLLDIGSHMLFDEMLSDKAKEAKNQVALVMKAWCMLNQDINKVSFESKNFNPLLEEIEVSEDEKQELNNVFDMIKEVHDTLKERKEKKIAKKIYTELHMISLVPYFKQAIESNTDTETIADWITDFFGVENSLSKSDDYNMACKGGTAKNDSIKTRHNELKLSYEDFFKEKE